MKRCNCSNQVNAKLEESGVELNMLIQMDARKGKVKAALPCLSVVWIGGKKPRGKTMPRVVCSYCPFCGKPLP